MLEDFISIHDLSVYQFSQIMDLTENIKAHSQRYRSKLKDRVLAMIFQKPSLRTRMTFEVGMLQLGGEAVYLSPSDIQMGKRDGSIKNTLPDMEMMQFLNIVTDGVIHETMRRRSALERINMKQETFVTNTINLLSVFLDDVADQ